MGKRKRKSKNAPKEEPEELRKAPHTFVIKRGKIGKNVNELMMNFRQILEPFTAMNLRVKRFNVVRDFVHIASTFNVTHLIVFTKTDKAQYMRMCRLPRGPTLAFKIIDYTLTSDVRSSLKKPLVHSGLFQSSPLLVMNGFSGDQLNEQLKIKLLTSMWRNMLPSIDVNKVNLNTIRRCVLINFNNDTQLIDFRHYAIKIKPIGLSRAVKKLISNKKIPDLGKYNDMSEVMKNDIAISESEGEANDEIDESRHITLPQNISSRGNIMNEKSAIRLVELGPRMTLELVKIEEGLMDGEVLFHSLIKKTSAEVKQLKQKREHKMFLKMSRKKQQEMNVKRKQQLKGKMRDTKQVEQNVNSD